MTHFFKSDYITQDCMSHKQIIGSGENILGRGSFQMLSYIYFVYLEEWQYLYNQRLVEVEKAQD